MEEYGNYISVALLPLLAILQPHRWKNFATPQVLLQVEGSERAAFWNSEVPPGYIRGPIGRDANGTGSSVINGINLNSSNTGSEVSRSLKLPALAVYNYLNSTFNETTVRVYSSEKASSGHIRDYHYSVNLVGKGEQSFVYLLLCITMLLTYSVLGFVYAFGIIMSNLKRGMRLIVAVPGAMLGSLASVAKVISYTVLMIAELVLNIMLYMLTTDLIFSVASVITTTFVSTAAGIFSSSFVSSGAFSTLVSILVIIFLVWFTIQAIKLRKPVIKSLEEMADNVVNRFITGQTSGGNVQGSGGQGENSAAKGAQIAAMEPKRRFRTPIGRACEKMNDTSKQEAFLGQMFGGNGSAFKEDQAFRQRDLEKRAAKKHARREMLEAGKQMAVGAGEFAAGAATGNAALMAQGAKTTLRGIGTANQVSENKYQADKNADTKLATTLNPDMAKHDERLGYTKGQSKDIVRMSFGNEMAQAAQLGGTGSDKAVSTLKQGSAGSITNSGDDTVTAYTGGNMDVKNAMVPRLDMVTGPENSKNIRRRSKGVEKISVDNEIDQEVRISSTDENKMVSSQSSYDTVSDIDPKDNIGVGRRADKSTVKGAARSEVEGLLENIQENTVYTPQQTNRTVSGENIVNTNGAENNGQKNVNNSGKNTRKSMEQGYDEEVHIRSSKKVVEHVKDKHETIREYSGDPAASDEYENHNFVEQKLLTHVDQTGETMKNRKMPYKADDKNLNKQTGKSRQIPKNKKYNAKGMQE